ncbi:MAG: sugar ABC transporter permease [Eubacteriales bacterium]|nr:sugar ABC transporter permease [Eubacteriales bacterium]MDD4421505.1 sugar ABC transporter permease [Eubacteriales bacterium]HBR32552.1 sugar ABC transporter permease [Clostridiales bacterium]
MDKTINKSIKTTNSKPITPNAKNPRKTLSLQKQKAKMGWLFIAPFLIGFAIIYLPMIFESIRFSFNKIEIQGGGGYILNGVGWENYSNALFKDTQYVPTLLGSIKDLFLSIPAIIIFSLFIAVLLNQKMKGRAVFRAIFFIPVIVSTGIIERIDLMNSLAQIMGEASNAAAEGMETTTTGTEIISIMDIENLFRGMRVGTGLVEYVVEMANNVYDIINKSGVQMLIFLAGLQSISPAIYESCYIDGASPWETFWKITFPMISPMILVNSVYTIIDSFTSESNQVMTYIHNVYNKPGGNVQATAMSWMYFLVVIIILAIIGGIMSAYVFYQKRDT